MISSLWSSMNCRKSSTVCRARSVEYPACSTSVDARLVDDLLVGATKVDDLDPQLRVRLPAGDGSFNQVGSLPLSRPRRLARRVPVPSSSACVLVVGIERGDQSLCDLLEGRPVGGLLKSRLGRPG